MKKIDYKLIPNKSCDGILVIFVKTSRNIGDEENDFKVNRHAVREYLEVLRPKAIQSCQSFDIL